MFSSGPNYPKLKTNLRLAVNRLKLLEKKKTELAQKARKEIADYISTNKEDRARIRVEHIVREDYTVEAYELVEMYCDMLLARFGLIQQMKALDEGIEEAVNSILWAAPRMQTEVQELKIISDMLTIKYGKPFAEACRENKFNRVSPKLLHKLSVQAPPKVLVEKYMIEIAKSHNIPFVPDKEVLKDDEVAAAEAMLIDFQNRGQQGYGWLYPQPGGNGGAAAAVPPSYATQSAGYPGPPPPPQFHQQGPPPQPFNYPPMKPAGSPYEDEKPPLQPKDFISTPSAPPAAIHSLPDFPEPPQDNVAPRSAPTGGDANEPGGGDDLDFDDLTRRFEDLKKKR